MDEYEYLQRGQESAAPIQESQQQGAAKTEKPGDASNIPNGQNNVTPFVRSLHEAPAEAAEGIDMLDKRPDKLIDLSADGEKTIISNPSKKKAPELTGGQNTAPALNAPIPNNEALQTTASGANVEAEAPLTGGALVEDKKMLAPTNPADPKMGEKDIKLLSETKPADAAQTPAPESQYWTKELLQPLAKVLAPEQMAELENALAYIHPDKQFSSAGLKQSIVFPAIPLVVPIIIKWGEAFVLSYIIVTTAAPVVQATESYITNLLSRYFNPPLDWDESIATGAILPTVEVPTEKPSLIPTPTDTDFIDCLPFSIYIPKPNGQTKPKSGEPKEEKPKAKKTKSEKPKKDPKQPSDGGLLPLAGIGLAANEWYKNRKKQESPKANWTEKDEKELKKLEKIPFHKRSLEHNLRIEILHIKKQQEEAQTVEKLKELIDAVESNTNLTSTEREKLLASLREKLANLLEPQEQNKEAEIKMMPILDLYPTHYPNRNQKQMQRFLDTIQVDGIKESIKYVLHLGEKRIVDGHHRYFAAKKLGITEVPTQQVELPYQGYKTTEDLTLDGQMPKYWNFLKVKPNE